MEPFVTLIELKARLDWVLDSDEEREAESALEELSDDARHYGRNWLDAATAPRQVFNLVLKAAKRHLRNPDGYTQSRAGDETLAWTDRGEQAGSAYFTRPEIKMLQRLGNTTIVSVPVTAWGRMKQSAPGYVPVAGYVGEKSFPYYADENEPW